VWDVSRVALHVFPANEPGYLAKDVSFDATLSEFGTWSWPAKEG